MAADYKTDAVIITAVEVETQAVFRSFDGWKRLKIPGDEQAYYGTENPGLAGLNRDLHIITAQQKTMGMTATAVLAAKTVAYFRPRYLIMCGIAAGLYEEGEHELKEREQMFGDVLVPDVVWDYSTGKYVGPDEAEIRFGDLGFLPRPVPISLDPELKKIIEHTINLPDNEFHVHIGPIACGSSVIANASFIQRQVRALSPWTIGLDMESYGVFYVAENVSDPKPRALVVKSVCDFGNEEKDDRYQKFAAYTSVQYLRYLLEKHLPFA